MKDLSLRWATTHAQVGRGSGQAPKWAEIDSVPRPVEHYGLGEPTLDIELTGALTRCDEAAIWRHYNRVKNQDRFLACLANLAGRYSTEQKHKHAPSTIWHHALFAVPFLLPPARPPRACAGSLDPMAASAVCARLQAWLGYQQPVRVVAHAVTYEELCNWSPLLQREYLQALAWRKSSCSRPHVRFTANVPDDWPRLAFVLGSVQRWNSPPTIMTTAAIGCTQWELRACLAAHLGYIHQRPMSAGDVLTPRFFPAAILAGLHLWIDELHRRELVCCWDLQLGVEDYLLLELSRCSGDEVGKALLPIRLHQIGHEGLRELLLGLHGRAATVLDTALPH